MTTIALEDSEWNMVMAQLAEGPWKTMNPLLLKIGTQLQYQRQHLDGVNHATQGNGERPDSGADASRIAPEVAAADHSDSAQQRTSRSPRKT
jgi:hypothetical protein